MSGGGNLLHAQSDVCEYPLFIQQSTTEANVMFLFDNSNSMNEAMYHDDYDPNVEYNGDFNPIRFYYVSSNGSYTPRDFYYRWPREPYAYLVESDLRQSGLYLGNYMNWIYYHATEEQRASIPTVTRIQVAKPAVADIIANTENIRFGIMEFNYRDGGHLVAGLGTSRAEVLTKLNNIVGTTFDYRTKVTSRESRYRIPSESNSKVGELTRDTPK